MIYSRSKNKWLEGKVTQIDGEGVDEWLVVKYGQNNKKIKRIQRNCADIKPIPPDHPSFFVKGSFCSILSPELSIWCDGEVIDIFHDEQGEWLKVKYNENGTDVVCDIQRYSNDIKLLTEKQKIKNADNGLITDQNFDDWQQYFSIDEMDYDKSWNINTDKDINYKFSKNNCFVDGNDKCTQIIKDLEHPLHNMACAYHKCIQYLVYGYFSLNYDNHCTPMDVQNLCAKYLGFGPFLFEIGFELMSRQGDMTNAILSFEAYIKDDRKLSITNKSDAFKHLGRCHADNEDDDSAIIAYLECNRLNENDLDALIALGLAYTNQVDEEKALKYLKQFIVKHPDYTKLADMDKGNKSDHQHVACMFNKALEINENDIDLHIVLGILYNISSEFDTAAKHFDKATKLKSDDASLWNKLGATLANGGKPKEAIDAYLKALKLRPNYTRVSSNLGISYANINKQEEACKAYLFGLKLNPSSLHIWNCLRMSLISFGRFDLSQLCDQRNVELFREHFEF